MGYRPSAFACKYADPQGNLEAQRQPARMAGPAGAGIPGPGAHLSPGAHSGARLRGRLAGGPGQPLLRFAAGVEPGLRAGLLAIVHWAGPAAGLCVSLSLPWAGFSAGLFHRAICTADPGGGDGLPEPGGAQGGAGPQPVRNRLGAVLGQRALQPGAGAAAPGGFVAGPANPPGRRPHPGRFPATGLLAGGGSLAGAGPLFRGSLVFLYSFTSFGVPLLLGGLGGRPSRSRPTTPWPSGWPSPRPPPWC